MKKITIIALFLVSVALTRAQILQPVKWSYGSKMISKTEAMVFIKATIDQGWHTYSQSVPDGGPIKTTFTFPASDKYELVGQTSEPKPISKFEKVFNMNVAFFEHSVVFQQKIKLKGPGPVEIKGSLEFMTCNDQKCLPPSDIDFTITVK
ncbi:MAG TPA: protein-disulfide reductase DsbD domain-containing protein [Puia sp.]|nr:protein-disulfide reductase DsbD domain-containing protein [Puia sp.]